MSSSSPLRTTFVAAALAALASCGFHLRGDARYDFGSLYINAPSAGQLATELRRTIAGGSEATIVDKPDGAQAILDITDYRDDKSVLSLSGGGRVREYLLTKHVAFRLHDGEGRDWLPPGEITIRRNYSYNEAEALAREQQEARLLHEMQSDAVAQIVRRLQAARKPA